MQEGGEAMGGIVHAICVDVSEEVNREQTDVSPHEYYVIPLYHVTRENKALQYQCVDVGRQ